MTINQITSVEAIQAAETKELIEFYNEFNPEKPIKKFADRPTAEKRCSALLQELIEDGTITPPKQAKTAKADAPAEKKSKEVDAESTPNESTEASTEASTETTNDSFTWPFGDKKIKSSPQGIVDVEAGSKKSVKETITRKSSSAGYATNAAGIAASWSDPDVASARLTRHGVSVEVNGRTTEHRSTREAFRHYRLMDSKHIRFRGILKAATSAVYVEKDVEYKFTIIG